MQRYTPTFTSASSLVVGMDVHKKTIALCVYDDSTGEVIDERQLPHDMPRIRKYVQKLQRGATARFVAATKRRPADSACSVRCRCRACTAT